MSNKPKTRKSYLEKAVPYFWTATIHEWKYLLVDVQMKMEVIQSLQWLTERKLANIYGYVIMPNHMHLVWTINESNGKESLQGSLLKFTAHRFKKIMLQNNPQTLKEYEVNASNKQYEFWQRDSLAVPIHSRPFMLQKMNYIHNNPVAKHWRLAIDPSAYEFSSASFYETGIDPFGILTHVSEIY